MSTSMLPYTQVQHYKIYYNASQVATSDKKTHSQTNNLLTRNCFRQWIKLGFYKTHTVFANVYKNQVYICIY